MRNDKDNQVYHFNCLDDSGHHDIKSDSIKESINDSRNNVLNNANDHPADE